MSIGVPLVLTRPKYKLFKMQAQDIQTVCNLKGTKQQVLLHYYQLIVIYFLHSVINPTSTQEECTITPLNPTTLTATGGALAIGTENVMIQCSCTIYDDDRVRWYDPGGFQLYNNASKNFTSGTPHYTRVESSSDNMNVILVIPTFNDTYNGTYYCGIRVNRTTFRAPNANVVLTIAGELMRRLIQSLI